MTRSVSRFPRCALLAVILVIPAVPAAQSQNELAARSQEGSAALRARRFEEAVRIFRELATARPEEAGLHMNLGMALAMAGQEADAIAPLERAVALNPALAPAHLFLGSSYLALGHPDKAVPPLERAVAGGSTSVETRRMLASAYAALGRHAEAAAQLRRVTEAAPKMPAGWYALGHAYNALAQDALASFQNQPEDSPWRRVLVADALAADGRLADAFALYREMLAVLPAMTAIRDSIARIYERSGRSDWAAQERAQAPAGPKCAGSKAMCEFRAGRHRAALSAALAGADPESQYWRIRAATALAEAAFKRLDALPDSRERREVRATRAMAERRFADAVTELKVALSFAPGDPALLDDLGSAYYFARDYEPAVSILSGLLKQDPASVRLLTLTGDALAQLQRLDEAIPLLQSAAAAAGGDPTPRSVLGRAYVMKGEFAAAIPLLEPQLAGDRDGSVHVQLARAYQGVGNREKAEPLLKRAQELQERAQARDAASEPQRITPPKGH